MWPAIYLISTFCLSFHNGQLSANNSDTATFPETQVAGRQLPFGFIFGSTKSPLGNGTVTATYGEMGTTGTATYTTISYGDDNGEPGYGNEDDESGYAENEGDDGYTYPNYFKEDTTGTEENTMASTTGGDVDFGLEFDGNGGEETTQVDGQVSTSVDDQQAQSSTDAYIEDTTAERSSTRPPAKGKRTRPTESQTSPYIATETVAEDDYKSTTVDDSEWTTHDEDRSTTYPITTSTTDEGLAQSTGEVDEWFTEQQGQSSTDGDIPDETEYSVSTTTEDGGSTVQQGSDKCKNRRQVTERIAEVNSIFDLVERGQRSDSLSNTTTRSSFGKLNADELLYVAAKKYAKIVVELTTLKL